ncbi:MAG: hypothetical protein N2039_08560 [Gemmataceae bacterium]|nr:hypothetical protein [Gemmataceae bacterium]
MKQVTVVVLIILALLLVMGVVCIGMCGGLAWFGYSVAKGAFESADEFLVAVGQGKFDEAYQEAATGLRNSESLESFTEGMKKAGLDGYMSSSWTGLRAENNLVTVEGTVTTKTGTVPLKITLVKENDKLRVLRIDVTPGGSSRQGDQPKLPGDAELRRLVRDTMRDLSQAIREESFVAFYEKISTVWKAQTDAGKLEDAFKDFFPLKDRMAAWEAVEPVFDTPPRLDENNILKLKGYLAARDGNLNFDLTYVYEHPTWKLAGISAKIVTPKKDSPDDK